MIYHDENIVESFSTTTKESDYILLNKSKRSVGYHKLLKESGSCWTVVYPWPLIYFPMYCCLSTCMITCPALLGMVIIGLCTIKDLWYNKHNQLACIVLMINGTFSSPTSIRCYHKCLHIQNCHKILFSEAFGASYFKRLSI